MLLSWKHWFFVSNFYPGIADNEHVDLVVASSNSLIISFYEIYESIYEEVSTM